MHELMLLIHSVMGKILNEDPAHQQMNDQPLKKCPECGGVLRRLIGVGGGVFVKGGGKTASGNTSCSLGSCGCSEGVCGPGMNN